MDRSRIDVQRRHLVNYDDDDDDDAADAESSERNKEFWGIVMIKLSDVVSLFSGHIFSLGEKKREGDEWLRVDGR